MPPKRKPPTKKQQPTQPQTNSSLTPSEQEIINDLPPPGFLSQRIRTPNSIITSYLIYVLLYTNWNTGPKVITRNCYESQFEALEAFKREYGMWVTDTFPARKTDQQLTAPYLINILEMSKKRDAASTQNISAVAFEGRGKIKYALVHRDDIELDDDDPDKRQCIIVCQETTFERS